MKRSRSDEHGTTARSTVDAAVSGIGIAPISRILAAVSGGADSTAMLRSLVRVAAERSWFIGVGHVNHQLRGSDSERDELFVQELAGSLGLPYLCARVDVMRHSKEHRMTIETAGRELRYSALHSMLREWPGDIIAVAHTIDDQAETVLMNLLRGSGLTGLGGMRDRTGPIVRPLLGVTHENLVRALQEDSQGYRVDASNADERHTRVRLRRTVFPVLRGIQPHPERTLARAAALLQDDAAFLADQARQALELIGEQHGADSLVIARATLNALHPSLRRAVLRLAIERVRGSVWDVSEAQVQSLVDMSRNDGERRPPLQPLSGLHVTDRDASLHFRRAPEPQPAAWRDAELPVPGRVEFGFGSLEIDFPENVDAEELRRRIVVGGPHHALVDADTLQSPLIVGPRRPGDRMQPLGSDGSKTVKAILIDRKTPRAERGRIVIVRTPSHVVWIVGYTIDARFAVGSATKRVAHLRFQPSP